MLNNPGTAAMAKARVKDAKQGDLPALAAGWNVLTAAWLEVMNLQGEAITASPLSARFGYASPSGQGRSLGRSTLVIDTGSIHGARSTGSLVLAAGFSYSGEVTGSTRSPVPEVEVYCRNEGHKPPTDYD